MREILYLILKEVCLKIAREKECTDGLSEERSLSFVAT